MACYSPLRGYLSRYVSTNGKRPITFDASSGYVDKPMTVPCGVCIGCRIDRTRQWALRCVHESKLHTFNSFVTLTYNDENLPPGGALDKTHLQEFFKRLRSSGLRFRYFACGEYGDLNKRPHYHVLFFGEAFTLDRKKTNKSKHGGQNYSSAFLEAKWGLGIVQVSDFNYKTAAYTARYCVSKLSGKMAEYEQTYSRVVPETGEIIMVPPEFALMSRRPGLGDGWYQRNKNDAFPSDFLIHEGKKYPVPRFYTEKLKKESEVIHKEVKLSRKHAQKKQAHNATPDRLYVREECHKAKLTNQRRNI
ncbi:MAG: replication initiator protein [Microvirus sp.]|nr:MAG: replication initiator protein [Microvirus sp.]